LGRISDLRGKTTWGSLESLHMPYYIDAFNKSFIPAICERVDSCQHLCYDKSLTDTERLIGFDQAKSKGEKCEELRAFLGKSYVWSIFQEFVQKYHDNESHGAGSDNWKKKTIEMDAYDNLAEITFSILYYYYKTTNRNILDPYNIFASKLNNLHGSIINLNYDLLLDDSVSNDNIKIFRPHGSFKHVVSENPSSLYKTKHISDHLYELESKNDIDNLYRGNTNSSLIPALVAYGEIEVHSKIPKTKQAQIIKKVTENVLKETKESLKNTKKIISIGYSFSENATKTGLIDKHLLDLFHDKDIYVVSKDYNDASNIATRVKKYYKDIRIYPTSFEGFKNYVNAI